MELIVHLGAHRTGSTAFERALTTNADLLRDEGLVIWPPKMLREMHHFPRIFDPATRLGDAADELEAALTPARQAGADRLLISEENMIGTMTRNLRHRSFYTDVRARLAGYAAILPQAPARVALGVRSYAAYWQSCYLFVLRRRDLAMFDDLAGPLSGARMGWLDIVEAARAVFPDAEILVWPQEALNDRVTEIAARVIHRENGAAGLVPLQRRVNSGPSPADVPLIFQAREQEPVLARKALDKRLVRLRRQARKRGDATEPPPLFTPAQQSLMARRYASDIAALAQGHCGARLLVGAELAEVVA